MRSGLWAIAMGGLTGWNVYGAVTTPSVLCAIVAGTTFSVMLIESIRAASALIKEYARA